MRERDTMRRKGASRRLRGLVVGSAMEKTVKVRVERLFRHPRFKRVVRRQRMFLAHAEEGQARVGDEVVIEETRPLSRRKRWKIVEILKRAAETGKDELGTTEG